MSWLCNSVECLDSLCSFKARRKHECSDIFILFLISEMLIHVIDFGFISVDKALKAWSAFNCLIIELGFRINVDRFPRKKTGLTLPVVH